MSRNAMDRCIEAVNQNAEHVERARDEREKFAQLPDVFAQALRPFAPPASVVHLSQADRDLAAGFGPDFTEADLIRGDLENNIDKAGRLARANDERAMRRQIEADVREDRS